MLSKGMSPQDTPVLLITFNRPEQTFQLIETLRQFEPKAIYVACDGPRTNEPSDLLNVMKVREVIDSQINWPCQVHRLFRDQNVGCKIGPSSAITWFFSQVEAGIILEDDCIPDLSFFNFCAKLLQKYKDNKKVMMISGDCFLDGPFVESYYFTVHMHIWGWATWRRAWARYDIEINGWPETSKILKRQLGFRNRVWKAYKNGLTLVKLGKLQTWDYQWAYSIWMNQGLTICPTKNLITNIGFDLNATHTIDSDHVLSARVAYSINFPLTHPELIERNLKLERKSESIIFPSLLRRIWVKLLKLMRSFQRTV